MSDENRLVEIGMEIVRGILDRQELEAAAREALDPKAFGKRYFVGSSERKLARGVLELLEERERLEQENNRLYEAMQNCRENNRRKGEELAGLLLRIDRAREALAPREERKGESSS